MKPPDSNPSPTEWTWKAAESSGHTGPNLKYEPGNLGDLLKGIWAIETTLTILRSGDSKMFTYADPFAGAPSYPLTEAAAQRLAHFDPSPFHEKQREYFPQGRLASTASLVKQVVEAEPAVWRAHLFELNPIRREAWSGVEWLKGESGEAALLHGLKQDLSPNLILIDPYDFLKGGDWKIWWPEVMNLARNRAILIYIYNRAPQSAGHFNIYRDFRNITREKLGPNHGALFGRIPNDFRLPRAYHEMALIAPSELLGDLKLVLETHTKLIAQKLSSAGVFEAE